MFWSLSEDDQIYFDNTFNWKMQFVSTRILMFFPQKPFFVAAKWWTFNKRKKCPHTYGYSFYAFNFALRCCGSTSQPYTSHSDVDLETPCTWLLVSATGLSSWNNFTTLCPWSILCFLMIAEMEESLGSHQIAEAFPSQEGWGLNAGTVLSHQKSLWWKQRGLIQTIELTTGLTAYGNRDKRSAQAVQSPILHKKIDVALWKTQMWTRTGVLLQNDCSATNLLYISQERLWELVASSNKVPHSTSSRHQKRLLQALSNFSHTMRSGQSTSLVRSFWVQGENEHDI